MLQTFLLLFLFWSLGPGLLALWVCREGGRSPLAGFLSGLLLGPLGIFAALLFVRLAGPAAHTPQNQAAGAPVRFSYKVPLLGRLHVTTVWSLAGLATFVCVWGAGGLGYEMLYPPAGGGERARLVGVVADGGAAARPLPAAGGAGALPAEAQSLQGNLARTQMSQPSFLDSLASEAKQVRPAPQSFGAAGVVGAAGTQAEPNATPGAGPEPPAPQSAPAPEPSKPVTAPSPTATQPPAPAPQTAVGEVTRMFGANGHRVYASVSGAGRTTTLSVSGPTLTRGAGSQLLGNGRVREALKSSGVRIVVLVNGTESWTFLL